MRSARRSRRARVATKLKVTGINLFSAGDFAEGKDREEIVLRDAARGDLQAAGPEGRQLIGAVMYGDTSDGAWFFDLIKKGTDIAEMRETLIFGPSLCRRRPAGPYGGRCSLAG